MQFRAVKGMNDILPGSIERWHRLEAAFVESARLHGFEEIRTPLVEPTELFTRSIGEGTDVVQKEMYTFDRHGDSLTLRPEGTASCVRAYIQHSLHAKEPVTRWYYAGSMYRAERPQRGRYREFYQAGCEIYGDPGPACDAELIGMLVDLFSDLGVSELKVLVNSVGGEGSRQRYRDLLLDYLRPRAEQLSEVSRERLEKNPLRILDSKSPVDREVVAGAPSVLEALDEADRQHWNALRQHLDALAIPYQVEPGLVRGLDYYSRTLFEIQSTAGEVGSQNALVGGGRYDGLVKSLGGPDVPGIGFAMGLDRILLAMSEEPIAKPAFCYLAPVGEASVERGLTLARELRRAAVRAEFDGRENSLKSKLRRANSMGARWCLVFGAEELQNNRVQVKDLAEHRQEEVSLDAVVGLLKDRLGGNQGARS
jgi:histidyl-tRNA synthetase